MNTFRRKRSADNSTVQEQQLALLQNYMDTFDQMPEMNLHKVMMMMMMMMMIMMMNLHKDMVAKYLECGSGQPRDSPSLHGCLQKLYCIQNDESVELSQMEREVANM